MQTSWEPQVPPPLLLLPWLLIRWHWPASCLQTFQVSPAHRMKLMPHCFQVKLLVPQPWSSTHSQLTPGTRFLPLQLPPPSQALRQVQQCPCLQRDHTGLCWSQHRPPQSKQFILYLNCVHWQPIYRMLVFKEWRMRTRGNAVEFSAYWNSLSKKDRKVWWWHIILSY